MTEEGTNLSFGQTRDSRRKNPRPIVRPTELNQIQFASAEYDRTLFGMVTNEALIKVVLALRDNVGPNFITPWEPKTTTAKEGQETPTIGIWGNLLKVKFSTSIESIPIRFMSISVPIEG